MRAKKSGPAKPRPKPKPRQKTAMMDLQSERFFINQWRVSQEEDGFVVKADLEVCVVYHRQENGLYWRSMSMQDAESLALHLNTRINAKATMEVQGWLSDNNINIEGPEVDDMVYRIIYLSKREFMKFITRREVAAQDLKEELLRIDKEQANNGN